MYYLSKLDKYYNLIKQKLSIRGASVRAVYEFILSERDPDIGTYSNFNKYIKSKGHKPVKTVVGHPRFENRSRYSGSGRLERRCINRK